jgi:hypothetical protein
MCGHMNIQLKKKKTISLEKILEWNIPAGIPLLMPIVKKKLSEPSHW